MGEGILIYGVAKERRGGLPMKPQSLSSVVRHYYKEKMSPFLSQKIEKEISGRNIKIGFTTYGNKHLYSDASGRRSKSFFRGDLLELPSLMKRSVYITSAGLSKQRKDKISAFHYFKVTLHGNTAYLNVAEEIRNRRAHFYVYSVTDKIKAT